MPLRIKTPSRIHLTLVDLNGKIGRIDGGAGVALAEPYIEVIGSGSQSLLVKGDAINLRRFRSVAERLSNIFGKAVEIEVRADYKNHVGLGSGTQISLAVGEIYNRLFELNLGIRKIAEIVGRGGTSGIGIAAFELGGFVVDGGHSTKEKRCFLPSSASKAKAPPVIARHDFPPWKIVVVVPELSGFSGLREVNLFQKYCPMPIEDVREVAHLILMKLLPAVVECDLDSFGSALWRIQHLGFKRVEVNQYGNLVWDAMKKIKEVAPAVGMSSTGPAIFAIMDSDTRYVVRRARNYFKEKNLSCEVVVTRARNEGAEVKEL
jgi:beta-ribofuranosylaminobenzene 5'-phosphate synthase